MADKKEKAPEPEIEFLFESIDNPKESFGGSFSEAYEELAWRGFRMLFQKGRIESATTRELNMITGTSIDKIQDLYVSQPPQDTAARIEKHRQAQERLQLFMKDYGKTRAEAMEIFKEKAPLVYQILSTGQNSEMVS